MTFEPINIKIKDPRRFSEVAYLVDSPLFIKETTKIPINYIPFNRNTILYKKS